MTTIKMVQPRSTIRITPALRTYDPDQMSDSEYRAHFGQPRPKAQPGVKLCADCGLTHAQLQASFRRPNLRHAERRAHLQRDLASLNITDEQISEALATVR